MDEISFRASEKFENLQIQLSLAAQQTKILFQQYSERGVTFANQAWHNPKMEKIQDLVKDLIHWMIEAAEKSKLAVLEVADPSKFVDEILRLLRNEVNRRSLLFGCLGFLIGSFVGYSVARMTQKPPVYSSHMIAAVCSSYGGIDCASLIDDVPIPRIEDPDEILVQVKASSISLVDVKICQGYAKRLRKLLCKYNHYSKTVFPLILGRCCSGIVLEIGQNVSRFEIGDEVYLTAPYWAQGTTSTVCLAKEFRVAHKPKRIGFEGAAGLPYVGSIALNAVNMAGITKDNALEKRVLICGACTPIGCVLIQYCHLLGAEITATSNLKSAPVAQALGADDVIIVQENNNASKLDLELNHEKPKLLKKELDLRDLFDVIFVTKDLELTKDELRQFCKPNGKLISTLPEYLPSDHFGFIIGGFFWSYIRSKCFLQSIFGLPRSNFGEPEINYNHLDNLTDLVDNNQVQSVVDKVFQPHDIEEILEHVQSANSIGSSIVTFR